MASVEHIHAIRAADPGFSRPAHFDRVARIYRVMEYLTFGPMLERCRFHYLAALRNSRRALVLGDGDGRFLARLLAANPTLQADSLDASPAMLALLRQRIAHLKALDRLTTTQADVRTFSPPSTNYDLVATHFFLDCLTEPEADYLIARIRPHLAPGTQWLVSEFQIPETGRLQKWFASSIISALYVAFRLLTGLTVRQIPPWPELLTRHGFHRKARRTWLGGLLVSELWEFHEATGPSVKPSQP
jgi:ubiquinone/menaquinone biosynthesis C-methylase UbiE